MTDTHSFLLEQERSRVAGRIASALTSMRRAQSCREAVRHMRIHVHPTFRSLSHLLGVSAFKTQAEQRLRQIVDGQIEQFADRFLNRHSEPSVRLNARGALLSDWDALRGNAPGVYRYAHDHLRQVEHQALVNF